MEQETELYLVKRIKELETENAYLKGEVKGREVRERWEKATQKQLDEALNNRFFAEYQEYGVDILLLKSRAFDIIQDCLNLALAYVSASKKYILFTTKRDTNKQIDIEIDQDTYNKLWGAFHK